MDSKLAKIIDYMEAAGESEVAIADAVKAYKPNSPLKHVISMRQEDVHEHPHSSVLEDEAVVDPESEAIADPSLVEIPEAGEEVEEEGTDWSVTKGLALSQGPSILTQPLIVTGGTIDLIRGGIGSKKKPDLTGVTKPTTFEDYPEFDLTQTDINTWYEENQERLNNLEELGIEIPEVPKDATKEDIENLNTALEQQWTETVTGLYKQEVEDPYIESFNAHNRAIDDKLKDEQKRNIGFVIDNNFHTWWSEERIAEGLGEVLPDSYTVEEGIGDD